MSSSSVPGPQARPPQVVAPTAGTTSRRPSSERHTDRRLRAALRLSFGRGRASVLALSGSTTFELGDDDVTARARVVVRAGEIVTFTLQHRTMSDPAFDTWTHDEALTRLDDTTEAWRTWSGLHQAYEGPW